VSHSRRRCLFGGGFAAHDRTVSSEFTRCNLGVLCNAWHDPELVAWARSLQRTCCFIRTRHWSSTSSSLHQIPEAFDTAKGGPPDYETQMA
jgi:hypothetical protein